MSKRVSDIEKFYLDNRLSEIEALDIPAKLNELEAQTVCNNVNDTQNINIDNLHDVLMGDAMSELSLRKLKETI